MQPLIKHDEMKGEILALKVCKLVFTMCDSENDENGLKFLQSKQCLCFPKQNKKIIRALC